VDGYDAATKTVFEFNGCYFHGCLTCFPDRDRERQQQLRKEAKIRAGGYQVESMWECRWTAFKGENVEYARFAKSFALLLHEPLNPRDAFFGGRTNAAHLYHRCGPDESIRYVDFTSLYPWVNKYGCYPIGHPTIVTNPSLDVLYRREYFGLVKCKVAPPRNLLHPVLPLKFDGKLMFILCRSCMESNSKQCAHSVEERAFVGTWTTAEVYQAMDHGYGVLILSEVHHFVRSREGMSFSLYPLR
jgi:hypothetical protein